MWWQLLLRTDRRFTVIYQKKEIYCWHRAFIILCSRCQFYLKIAHGCRRFSFRVNIRISLSRFNRFKSKTRKLLNLYIYHNAISQCKNFFDVSRQCFAFHHFANIQIDFLCTHLMRIRLTSVWITIKYNNDNDSAKIFNRNSTIFVPYVCVCVYVCVWDYVIIYIVEDSNVNIILPFRREKACEWVWDEDEKDLFERNWLRLNSNLKHGIAM